MKFSAADQCLHWGIAVLVIYHASAGISRASAADDTPPTTKIEAESMKADIYRGAGAIDTGQVMTQWAIKSRQWSGNAQVFRFNPRMGDATELSFKAKDPAVGQLVLGLTKAPDYSRVTIHLDGQLLTTFDGYHPHVIPVRVPIGTRYLSPGEHVVRIAVVGKDDRSPKYHWGFDYLGFVESRAGEAGAAKAPAPLNFLSNYDDASQLAAKDRKRLLIVFSQPDIPASEHNERILFRDARVQAILSDYVLLKLRYDINLELAKHLNVFRAGTILIYGTSGGPAVKVSPLTPVTKFLSVLSND